MMCFYWQLYNGASAYDKAEGQPGFTYDNCGIVREEGSLKGEFTTGWTQVYKFNAIMYTIIVCFAFCGMFCLAVPMASCCGVCCIQIAIFPLIVAIIITGVRTLNATGKACSLSTEIVSEGVTFGDNGATLKALFITQCVMHVP